MKLTQAEKQRGWVIYSCPDHGDMLAAHSGLSVRCGVKNEKRRKCNKRCEENNGEDEYYRHRSYGG